MLKRFFCFFLTVMLLAASCSFADKPRDIFPLDYDSVPEPREGMHHYLFCCVDNWEGNAKNLGNTDGVLMVTLDTAAHRILFTTFSREMLVQRPDLDIGRFTYIAKNYGPEALCRIVTTHFGAKVDKYIIFSMDNIQSIIDAMGGVYITVTNAEANYLNRYRISRTSTTPSMDKAGTYLFGGHAAVIYMRIRKVGGDGDSGRTRRIRTVLTTLTNKYANATMDDAFNLLDAVLDNYVMTNMTMSDMVDAIGYCLALRGVEPEGIQMPADKDMTPITYAGMSTREVDFEASREKLAQFLEYTSFDVIE